MIINIRDSTKLTPKPPLFKREGAKKLVRRNTQPQVGGEFTGLIDIIM
jgi:hypothetical protein